MMNMTNEHNKTGGGTAPRVYNSKGEQELREALLTAQDTVGKLIAQRDELLAVLRDACEEHDAIERPVAQWYLNAKAAIAKVEGGEK